MDEVTSEQLTEHYIALTKEDLPAHAATAREANEYISHSTAQYHGRYVKTLYVPKIYAEREQRIFADIVSTISGIFDKVVARYLQDPGYRALFGFDKRLEELICQPSRYHSLVPIARIDIFLDEKTGNFKFCEFNTDGSSAMNEDRELNLALKKTKGYQDLTRKLSQGLAPAPDFGPAKSQALGPKLGPAKSQAPALAPQYSLDTMELFDSWAEVFLRLYREHTAEDAFPHVAIVDFMEHATEMEFEIFAEAFRRKGMETAVCEIRDLRRRDGGLYTPDGMRVDAIYRRAVTADIMEHYGEVTDFLEAVRANEVCLIGDFKTQIVHNKIIFMLLHGEETKSFLTPAECEFIKEHVPMTYGIHDGRICEKDVLANKDQWILKPQDSYGSLGVHAGVECTDGEWREYFLKERENAKSDYLLQEFCMPYRSPNIDLAQGGTEFFPVYNLTGLYAYAGKFSGVYSRISKSEIISTQYSEMSLPTLFLRTI